MRSCWFIGLCLFWAACGDNLGSATDTSSGDPASAGLPLGDLAAARTDAVCGYLTRCCAEEELARELGYSKTEAVTDLAGCTAALGFSEGYDQGVIADGVARGGIAYDGVRAQACVDAIAALACGGGAAVAFGGNVAACETYRQGQVAEGGACWHHWECQSSLCRADAGQEGVCVAPGGEGAWCPGVGKSACRAGFFCDAIGSMTCRPLQPSGVHDCTVISCADGLACQYDECKPLLADGAVCAADGFCAGGTCTVDAGGQDLRCALACDGR